MKLIVLCAVLVLCCGVAQAAGLPVESVGAVYVMPTSAEPGFLGGLFTVGLPIPDRWTLGGEQVKELIKGALVVDKVGTGFDLSGVHVYPGVAVAVRGKLGLPAYLGICYLPTVQYKTAWFAGVDLLTVAF